MMKKIEQNNRGLDGHELSFTKDGFCAIDICKDLKKIGFDETCYEQRSYRYPEGDLIHRVCRNSDYGIDLNSNQEIMLCAVPMHQQVQKWILKKYHIFLTVDLVFECSEHMKGEPFSAWSYYQWKAYYEYDCEETYVSKGQMDISYEEAMDHGIRSCLDEIINMKELIAEQEDLLA